MKRFFAVVFVFACITSCAPPNTAVEGEALKPQEEMYSFISENGVLAIPPLALRIETSIPLEIGPTFRTDSFSVYTGKKLYGESRPRDTFVFHIESIGYDSLAFQWNKDPTQFKFDVLNACQQLAELQALQGSESIPVRFDQALRCKEWDVDGERVVTLIGVGTPIEGADYPASMVLAFREKNIVIIRGDVQNVFPKIHAEIGGIFERHHEKYPDVRTWPPKAPSARKAYDDVAALIGNAIRTPTPEVLNAERELRKLADSISFSD